MSLKQRVADALVPQDGGRLWTWWRVAGVAFMVLALATIAMLSVVSACSRSSTLTGRGHSQEPAYEQQAGERPASPDAEAQKLVRKYSKAVGLIVTDKGTIRLRFFPEDAPITVDNFAKLANTKFYDGQRWHRFEPGFVIQAGDPNSRNDDPNDDGYGGPGYTIPPEFNQRKHVLGTLAMARSEDPNSAGSQFYITLGEAPFLDGQYTVFGQVSDGIEVVKKIRVGDRIKRIRVTGISETGISE